jgi:hypothetical protein|tara:strand:- start:132 stop:338 length:207 start_codon:yes stop_codon:yes gene_type:complete
METAKDFIPREPPGKKEYRHVNLKLPPADYAHLKRLAEDSGVSLHWFCVEAVRYAIENYGGRDGNHPD